MAPKHGVWQATNASGQPQGTSISGGGCMFPAATSGPDEYLLLLPFSEPVEHSGLMNRLGKHPNAAQSHVRPSIPCKHTGCTALCLSAPDQASQVATANLVHTVQAPANMQKQQDNTHRFFVHRSRLPRRACSSKRQHHNCCSHQASIAS